MLESSFSILTPTTKIKINVKATFVDCASLRKYEDSALFSVLCKEGCISRDYLEHDLLWYKDKNAPAYSSVVSALLTNNKLDLNEMAKMFSFGV